jgi:hypothetical protein
MDDKRAVGIMNTYMVFLKAYLIVVLTVGALMILFESVSSEFAQWWMYAWFAVIGETLLEKPISAIWSKK